MKTTTNTAMDTITTRQQYVALFASTAAAIVHEEACLSIAEEFLPSAAKAVRDGGEATPAYWSWLANQIEVE